MLPSYVTRLDRIKWNLHAIVFVVTVFSSGKDFKDVHDFFVSVAPEVGEQQQDLCRYSKAGNTTQHPRSTSCDFIRALVDAMCRGSNFKCVCVHFASNY